MVAVYLFNNSFDELFLRGDVYDMVVAERCVAMRHTNIDNRYDDVYNREVNTAKISVPPRIHTEPVGVNTPRRAGNMWMVGGAGEIAKWRHRFTVEGDTV